MDDFLIIEYAPWQNKIAETVKKAIKIKKPTCEILLLKHESLNFKITKI